MIPTYENIMLPFLKQLEDGNEHGLNELYDAIDSQFELTDEERRELLPSGRQSIFRNRVGWARTYLKKAGLILSPKRANFKISRRGIELLNQNPNEITTDILMRYDDFVEFRKPRNEDSNISHTEIENDTDQTPEESLEYAYQKLRSELSKDVLDIVKTCSPTFFEKLVIDLLIKMGYGGSRKDAGQAIGGTGDGGIDGMIKEDKLGLDIIYLQAKRWENPVPVREIRDFTGALAAKRARKGIFITTSTFPNTAYDYVASVEYKIILIDGQLLANLMIENNVGLSIVNTYQLKAIDTDYFEES